MHRRDHQVVAGAAHHQRCGLLGGPLGAVDAVLVERQHPLEHRFGTPALVDHVVRRGSGHPLGAPVHGVELAGPQHRRVAQLGPMRHLTGRRVELHDGVSVRAHREPVEAGERRVARAPERVEVVGSLGHGDVGVLGVLEQHPHPVGVVVDGVVVVDLGGDPEHRAADGSAGRGRLEFVLADQVQRTVVVGGLGALAAGQHLGFDLERAVPDDQPVTGLGDRVHRLRDDRPLDRPRRDRTVAVPAHDVQLPEVGVDAPQHVAVGVDDRVRGGHHHRQHRLGGELEDLPLVAMADLAQERERDRVDLDRTTDVPGGEQPVAPRQRSGVGGVHGAERRLDADHRGGEHVGPLGPEPGGRRVDATLSPGEAVGGGAVGAGGQRQPVEHPFAEERVRPVEGVGVRGAEDHLAAQPVGPGAGDQAQVQVVGLVTAQQRSRYRHVAQSSRRGRARQPIASGRDRPELVSRTGRC